MKSTKSKPGVNKSFQTQSKFETITFVLGEVFNINKLNNQNGSYHVM